MGRAVQALCYKVFWEGFSVSMHLCLKLLCAKAFCPRWFLCKRLLSDNKSFLACRAAEMSWDELQGDEKGWSVLGWDENVEKNLLRWHVRRDGMRWEEVRWSEKRWDEVTRAHMIWDEMKCRVWSASVKCEVWSTGCEVWRKCLLGVALRRGRAQVMFLDKHRATQSTHARAWLAHGACKFYRWKRSFSITLRQLLPRLVRVLLVYEIIPVVPGPCRGRSFEKMK